MRLQNHAVHLAVKRSHDLDVQLAEIDENHVHRNISASEEQICSYASESGAKLLHRARTMLVKLAKEHGLKLRQGNPKVGKRMKYQRLRMPSSSSARVARCDPSRHIWAASSATSIAKSDHRRRYRAPFDRSSMTRWRQRMGDARLEVLLQESLAMAVKTDAIEAKDLSKVIVDTTVQEKAITFPTDAKLLDRARTMLVKLAKKHGFELRQGIRAISDASGSLTIRLR